MADEAVVKWCLFKSKAAWNINIASLTGRLNLQRVFYTFSSESLRDDNDLCFVLYVCII